MVIKDRSGKTYQLRGPNPLLNEQQNWNREHLTFFNIGYKKEIIINKIKKKRVEIPEIPEMPEMPETKVVPAQEFLEELTELEIIEPELVLPEKMAQYYCSPAIGEKKHQDPLYGTDYVTTNYGEQFIFEAVIVEQSDFQLQIWSVKHIAINSIIYRKDAQADKRWWRLSETEPKTGGYLALANISEVNPYFGR